MRPFKYRTAASLSFLSRRAVHREQAHRHILVFAVAALIVFSTLPLFGHHLAGRADVLLAGRDHIGALCLVALHMLLAPVHKGFHLLFLSGLVFALGARVRAGWRLRRILQLMHTRVPREGDAFDKAAILAGLPRSCVRVTSGLPVPAFTAGWLRPIVYIDRALELLLPADQLAAVLAHEAAHVARRDPLRLSLLRFLAQLLFWVPALRRVADDAADEMELAADDEAVRAAESFSMSGIPKRGSLVLASAILSLADTAGHYGGSIPFAGAAIGVVGFHRDDLLGRRVRRLAGEETAFGTHLTRRSISGAMATLAAVWLSGLMMAHPLPPMNSITEHCEHHHSSLFSHFLCNGEVANKPCAHTGV